MMNSIYPCAHARPVAVKQIEITSGYWKGVLDQSRTMGLPRLLDQYEDRNIVRNFIAVAEGTPREEENNAANYDEFLYKALEAAAYYLDEPDTDQLREQYERIRDIVLSAQQPDGYLNTHATSNDLERFTAETHQEMYAGGHLMQAGIAELRTTGETMLFDAARRHVDRLIRAYTDQGRSMPRFHQTAWPDHPNFEMALVELYRVTGDEKYLDFCRDILDFSDYPGRTRMLHHAVMELLHVTGATDYYLETGDDDVWKASRRLHDDFLKKVYVTGAVGSTNRRSMRESVGKAFELTNDAAYAETCASISNVFWQWRLFLATGQGRYIDMLERALYNGVQAGVARNGYEYFYVNPHEYRVVDPAGTVTLQEDGTNTFQRGPETRQEVWPCSCCPPNVQRLLASLDQYIYAAKDDELWVNLFVDSELQHEADNGRSFTLDQTTNYPWEGQTRIEMNTRSPVELTLHLRIPAWCDDFCVELNGQKSDASRDDSGYLTLDRTWADGDSLLLMMSMPVRLVASHPKNIANYEKAAMMRGPLVYCLEQVDHPGVDIFSVEWPRDGEWRAEHKADLLGGVSVIEGHAWERDDSEWDARPYRSIEDLSSMDMDEVEIRAIPFYAWANRGRSSMVTTRPVHSFRH